MLPFPMFPTCRTYGAALYAKMNQKVSGKNIYVDKLIESQIIRLHLKYVMAVKMRVLSENLHLKMDVHFRNNCEKIYSNKAEDLEKGMNQHKERYKLLFNRDVSFLKKPLLKIGIQED